MPSGQGAKNRGFCQYWIGGASIVAEGFGLREPTA
jgi:hypothetical protein